MMIRVPRDVTGEFDGVRRAFCEFYAEKIAPIACQAAYPLVLQGT